MRFVLFMEIKWIDTRYFSLHFAELIPQLFSHHKQLLFSDSLIGSITNVNQIKMLMALTENDL